MDSCNQFGNPPTQKSGTLCQLQPSLGFGSPWPHLVITILFVLVSLPPAIAQRMDSFEGGETRWGLVESDCQAQLSLHEISLVMPHAGSACESFDVECGPGSMAFLAYPIEPCLVLNEFQPVIWTRSSSGQIQLGVRVVFPLAEHPVTEGRLNTILWGTTYAETGQWQMLSVDALEKKLSGEVIGLRQRYGADIDLSGAYIDCLVLNAYTGPGRCRIQLDDLNLRGLISRTSLGLPLASNWREVWRWRAPIRSAEQRFWETANRPPTWLHDYHRESLPWLKSLGFSGMMLNQLPSQTLLMQIQEAGLGVISPPPPHNLVFETSAARAIKGWSVGAALDARQADTARTVAMRISELPSDLRRPLVGEALEQYWLFSRIADEVIIPFPAALSAGDTLAKMQWVAQNLESTKKRGQGWVSIEIGPNPALIDQVRTAHQVIAPEQEFESSQANPFGMRYQAACAVMAGARGLVFRAFKPLEQTTDGDNATLAAIRWIHSDLELWGPWILGGQSSPPPTRNRDDYQIAAWSVSQSRLVLAIAMPPDAQYCVPATAAQPLELKQVSSTAPLQVFRLTEGRLERLQTQIDSSGMQWRVATPSPVETFVVTSNPLVIDFLRAQVSQQADQRAADQLDVINYDLSLAAKLIEARYKPTGNANQTGATDQVRQLALAQRQLEQGFQTLHSGQATAAFALSARASELVQSVLYEAHQTATSNLATPQSSPFVVSPTTLRYHWLLADACARSNWRELVVPGATLTQPHELERLGWSLEQRPLNDVDLQVEFLPSKGERAPGLRLAAYATTEQMASGQPAIQGGYEGATSRVRSAAAPVRAGQLVRISAKARILRPPTKDDAGLLLYDNQAGPSLGQLVRGKVGELVDIELYRFVVADGEFRILAECRGECDIVLESLNTSLIEPAVNRQSYETSPAQLPVSSYSTP